MTAKEIVADSYATINTCANCVPPILKAPSAPAAEGIADAARQPDFSGEFRRDLEGSDFLHWDEDTVSVRRESVAHQGRVSPVPDCVLYLSPKSVETEAEFGHVKPQMMRVGDVKVVENFLVPVPETVYRSESDTVVV